MLYNNKYPVQWIGFNGPLFSVPFSVPSIFTALRITQTLQLHTYFTAHPYTQSIKTEIIGLSSSQGLAHIYYGRK